MPSPTALVVFTDQHDLAWLRGLRGGFRHCFVVVRDPAGEWIACDWLKGRFVLRAYGPVRCETLAERFAARGHRVVVVAGRRAAAARPGLRALTCVEVAKQCLGLNGWRPLTPHGLFRHLLAAGHSVHENSDNIPIQLDGGSEIG